MTAGTGGTITRRRASVIKREVPGCKIIGVDPEGSILAGPGEIKSYKVEGIGYDFIPDVLDRRLVDRWIKSNDRDSFLVARQLIRQEGLLVGGSSGSAVWAAMQMCSELGAGKRVVVDPAGLDPQLPDQVRRRQVDAPAGLRQGRLGGRHRRRRRARAAARKVISLDVNDKLGRATELFKEHGISQMPVLDEGKLAGILTESDLLHHLVAGRVEQGHDRRPR